MTHAALIFSHSITPRLRYVIDFLSRYYGISLHLISDEETYRAAKETCKINYSYHRIEKSEIFIHSHVLLFESFIRPVKVECFEIRRELQASNSSSALPNSYKAFFRTHGDFEFDLFAAIFYLLSRYEEYLPHQNDVFGRYAHENAVAFKENFLHLPLINFWLEDFRTLLSNKNAEFNFNRSKFSFLPTYDIDMAWSFRNKGFKRNAAAIAVLFLKARFVSALQRIKVLRGKIPDPFDAYEWMDQLHERYGLKPYYFFLVAKEKGRHDKNIDLSNEEFMQLIKSVSSKYPIALHPSWASGDEPSLLLKEKHSLEQISSKPVDASRQHFIRMQFPSTYQRLLNAGILHDYSMGYGSINGFRASFAGSFFWYDLKSDTDTALQVHPFCFMDANSYFEQKLSAEQALHELIHYYDVTNAVNGTMIMIWHNSFLGTAKEFEGWREMYEEVVRKMVNPET